MALWPLLVQYSDIFVINPSTFSKNLKYNHTDNCKNNILKVLETAENVFGKNEVFLPLNVSGSFSARFAFQFNSASERKMNLFDWKRDALARDNI